MQRVTFPPAPTLSRTTALWHLSTPITGRLRDTSTTAIDLMLALHPTPAVGGVPADAAAQLIGTLEGDRGLLRRRRGLVRRRRRRTLGGHHSWRATGRKPTVAPLAHAGGGIVAESDPDAEVAETTTKFITILTALGVQP